MWVSRFAPHQPRDRSPAAAPPHAAGWQLSGNGKALGVFDAVVIAHNGKCANRLAAPAGAPAVARQLMRLRLSAVWALMVAFDGPVPAPGGFEGALRGAGDRGRGALYVANGLLQRVRCAPLACPQLPGSLSNPPLP